MKPIERRHQKSQGGYALITIVLFALVLLIGGFAFFSLVSGETKNALYRQDSSESFYLADGAIERARAKFLQDGGWDAGWTNEPNPNPDPDARGECPQPERAHYRNDRPCHERRPGKMP